MNDGRGKICEFKGTYQDTTHSINRQVCALRDLLVGCRTIEGHGRPEVEIVHDFQDGGIGEQLLGGLVSTWVSNVVVLGEVKSM